MEGTAEVIRRGQSLARLTAGDFVGEVGLVTKHDRNATVKAATDMWVLVADRGSFAQMLDDVPGLARHVLETYPTRQAEE